MTVSNYIFFLGGNDLEMQTIEKLLQQHVALTQIKNKNLGWGANASAYKAEIDQALAEGKIPVLIELENDLPDLGKDSILIVDHHQEKAGAHAATALQQIWILLGLSETDWLNNREYQLIAANDRGHIAAMQAMNANVDEIKKIRERDRHAQGITTEQEQQAQQAIEQRDQKLDGQLTVVNLPHSACATVTDRLHTALGGEGYENLVIFSPHEVNFYGDGQVIAQLAKLYPDSWYGGDLPQRGFWGLAGNFDAQALVAEIEKLICTNSDT